VTQGSTLGRLITLHTQKPRHPQRFRPDTVRITADDGRIPKALTLEGCDIKDVYREG